MTKVAEGLASKYGWIRPAGLALGLFIVLVMQALGPPDGLSREGWVVASMVLLMIVFWFTEALPLPITALIPLFALPLFAGMTPAVAAAPYANPTILLFIGGFMLAIAIERWRLSTRIAFSIVGAVGPKPKLIVGGFLVASIAISMWISNTATSLIMTPLALGVVAAAGGAKLDWRYAAALVMACSWGASIGGIGTPIGTPTNLIALSWLREETGEGVAFVTWVALALPLMVAVGGAAWLLLAGDLKIDREAGEQTQAEVRASLLSLGPLSQPELRTALVFGATAALWVGLTWLTQVPGLGGLNEMTIGIFAALALFLVPAGGPEGKGRALLTWEEAVKLPWGIMLLFGGGLSLAAAATSTGLGEWLGQGLGGLGAAPAWVVIGAAVLLPLTITQFTSNIATISMVVPVMAPLSMAAGVEPAALAIPAALAASFAFSTPVSCANNAIAYASGKVPVSYMMARGFILVLIGLVLTTLLGRFYLPYFLT